MARLLSFQSVAKEIILLKEGQNEKERLMGGVEKGLSRASPL
jgi:hypothetical protein